MNKTLIARLVVGAIATIAAGSVFAGQIQASSTSIAREVITSDAMLIDAPSIAYRFAGDVDARSQAQTFQVQFTLASGEWSTAPAADRLSISDGVSGVVQAQYAAAPAIATAGQVAVGIKATYIVNKIDLSADKKTVFATITVTQDPANGLIKQPLISINVANNTIAGAVAPAAMMSAKGQVTKLYAVVGSLVDDFTANGLCQDIKKANASFKHYVGLSDNNVIATDLNASPDEHVRGGATNSATILTFPTNVLVQLAPATGVISLTPGGNLHFASTTGNAAGTAFQTADLAVLGKLNLKQNGSGYDTNLTNVYQISGTAGLSGVKATADGAANTQVGDVEARDLKVTVTATQGFAGNAAGTNLLFLSTSPVCAAAIAGASATVALTAAHTAAGTSIDLVVPNAVLNASLNAATGADPIYVCNSVIPANTTTIPSSVFTAVGRLVKATGAMNEQDNICKGTYISLGGGLKIDVRNYASSAETSGYQSVLRFINPSDVRTADVWGQIIHQDGKLGGYGLLTTLAPRQVLNMTAAQIDAKLNTDPTAAVGAKAPAAAAAGAPRLRITSTTGDTLRVQNYMFNSATGQILEASGDQAVDFAGSVSRAPASEGQYQSQDAQSGLNLAP